MPEVYKWEEKNKVEGRKHIVLPVFKPGKDYQRRVRKT